MRNLVTILSMLAITSTAFGKLDCKQVSHAMDAAKCTFIDVMTNKSNAEVERVRDGLEAQGYSRGSVGEEPTAVFVRGTFNGGQGRYTYLVTTDVSSQDGNEMKSIGMVISSKISMSSNPEVRIEKAITSDFLQ